MRDALLCLCLGAVLFLPGLGRNDLWNPDEPRYAEVAREMHLSGEWLVPHFNGEVYTQKPPLLFWAIALSFALLGRTDEIAVRLPVALAGIATLPLILALGRRLASRRAGWLAVLVFGTCIELMRQARTAQIDMLLVFWVTLAMYAWVRGWLEQRRGWCLAFYAAAGVATLAKGPVGLLPPLLSILAFLWLSGERQEIRRLRLLPGLALWALVVLAWLVPAGLSAGTPYLEQILLRQNVTRYAQPWGHLHPWYYYLEVLPVEFFPWSFLLPTALLYGWRRLRGDASRRGFLFALAWVAVTFAFFSLSPGKRTVYVLTCYPALALLVGIAVDRLAGDRTARRTWLGWPLGLLAGLAAVAAVGGPIVLAPRPEIALLPAWFLSALRVTLALFAAGATAALVHALRGRAATAIGALAAGSGAAGLAIVLFIAPPLDIYKSARPLAAVLERLAAPDEPYGMFPRIDAAFLFYTGRLAVELRTADEVRAFVDRPGRVWLLAERDDLERLDPPLDLEEVARDADKREGHVLLVSTPVRTGGG